MVSIGMPGAHGAIVLDSETMLCYAGQVYGYAARELCAVGHWAAGVGHRREQGKGFFP